ncbi:MAG: hypothetical protein AAB654_00845 [Acidobacteriota bacterium]
MIITEIHARLTVLAGELPALRESEEAAAAALSEAALVIEAVDCEAWSGAGRGDMAAAVAVWREAEQRHQPAARALEANLAEAGRLRAALREVER